MAPEKFIDAQYLSKAIGVGTNEDANGHLKKLDIAFSYAKPESLIAFFLRAMTQEGDTVLDFFAGTGTTAAAAHKMNRRYIGIEQMDYIQQATIARLKYVIRGEQGGISPAVNWKGGGSFVYCELAEQNQSFADAIQSANDTASLWQIWEAMSQSGYISHKVDPKAIEENRDSFAELSLAGQKRFLMEVLDKNLLYVNACDMDDAESGLSEADRAFTRQFYGEA